MSDPRDRILARLRAGMIEELAGLVVDHVLDRPVTELIEPEWLAGQIVFALRAGTEGDRTEAWFRDQVQAARARVPSGKVGAHIPGEIVDPLREVLARPVVLDRELVGRLLDHAAVRGLVKDLLQGSLQGFAAKLRSLSAAVPTPTAASRGMGRLRALSQGVKAVGDGVLGGISKEIEERSHHRISEFIDHSLAAAMEGVADHICDPSHAASYGAYRAHVLDTVLDTDAATLNDELDKLDPDSLVATGAATARAIARRDGLEEELTRGIRAALDESGGRALRDFLAESGLEEAAGSGADAEWRQALHDQIARQATVFVDSPAFVGWLDRLLADDS